MNRFLQMIMLFGLLEGADSGVTGASAVIDTPPAVETTPVATETPAVGTETVVDAPAIDPNDPMAALQAAMDAQLGKDEPVTPPATPEAPAVPEAFAQALQISEYVKSPEHLAAAIRAADDVWNMATGKSPAAPLLENIKQRDPQVYQAIVNELVPHLFASPEAHDAVQRLLTANGFVKSDTPPDPVQQLRSEMEARYAKEETDRQQAVYQQQVGAARTKAIEFITAKTKGTFAEGQEAYMLQQAGAKAGIPEDQMVRDILSGKTDKLEAAFKAAQKEETARLRAYNANLVKQHNALKNGVPASKGAPVGASTTADGVPARKDGESDVEYGVRVWRSIK